MFLTTVLSAKVAAWVASGVIAVGSFSGVAYASNGALPGDTLYGFDRALESVGLGAGGTEERLAEAAELASKGEVGKGLAHAAEALQNSNGLGDEAQDEGLLAAIAAIQAAIDGDNEGQAGPVLARVAQMLQWMATTELQGKEFGQAVAERAREITNAAEQNGPPEDGEEGNGPPSWVPVQSGGEGEGGAGASRPDWTNDAGTGGLEKAGQARGGR